MTEATPNNTETRERDVNVDVKVATFRLPDPSVFDQYQVMNLPTRDPAHEPLIGVTCLRHKGELQFLVPATGMDPANGLAVTQDDLTLAMLIEIANQHEAKDHPTEPDTQT
jgi:hypothetical protein